MTPQELKASILQLAIQGKLVEQRPEEGTGEELFELIKPYHSTLKLCKDELDFSSMDFDLPESWKMVELNQLFDFVDYRGKTPTKITNGIFLVTASNIRQGYMDYTRKEYISPEEYETRKSRGLTERGDLLFTTEAPMGNAALCDLDECSCGQRIITFKAYREHTVFPKLFMHFILSPQFQQQLLDNCTGTTAKGIKADKLKHFLIPLPPLAEQKRIVTKIEELLPYIERYEQAWSRLEDFNRRFPVDMQKSILQMAIQGKLVEQRSEEGTGEELYQQIQQEKQRLIKAGTIKKEKPLPEITEDEIPFDIPEGWKWVRIGTLLHKLVDGTHRTPKYTESGIPFVSVRNMSNGKLSLADTKFISVEEHRELWQRCNPERNDILLSKVGTTGVPAKVDTDVEFSLFVSVALLKFNTTLLDIDFLVYSILAPDFQKQCKEHTRGVGNKNWVIQDIANTIMPLPPLGEQKRIVAKLEELLPLCERLK